MDKGEPEPTVLADSSATESPAEQSSGLIEMSEEAYPFSSSAIVCVKVAIGCAFASKSEMCYIKINCMLSAVVP